MNPPKCTEYDYIQLSDMRLRDTTVVQKLKFPSQGNPEPDNPPAHDSLNRSTPNQTTPRPMLYRLTPDSEQLWQESEPFVKKEQCILVIDDSTLDKPYARQMELVTRHWSGKHKQVVSGINLITLM